MLFIYQEHINERPLFVMFAFNTLEFEISTFLLIGIPGLEHVHIWISIPICFMYLLAILDNCTILFVIRTEPSLHEPMCYFLSMLTLSDLGLSFSSLPSMLRIFLFNAMEISADACIAQEFFIHEFTDMESSVLLIMSFDCFLAICTPLRCSLHSYQLQSFAYRTDICYQKHSTSSFSSFHFKETQVL